MRNIELIGGTGGGAGGRGGGCSRNFDLIVGLSGGAGGGFARRRDITAIERAILVSANSKARPAMSARNRETR